MAKQLILTEQLVLMLLLGILIAASLVIADNPPNLINHQFYGEVRWGKDSIAPEKVTAKVGDKAFVSVIKSSPCLEELCTGGYGYDPDNILRVQGQEGNKIKFWIDGIEVKEYIYKAGEVTKLDFDLTLGVLEVEENISVENKIIEDQEGGGGKLVNYSAKVNATPKNVSKIIPEKEPAEPLPEVLVKEPQVSPPPPEFKVSDFKPPQLPEEKPAVEAGKKEEAKTGLGSKFYIFVGVVLIVIAIIVTFFLVRRGRGGQISGGGGVSPSDSGMQYPPR